MGTLNSYRHVVCMCWQQTGIEVPILGARAPLHSTVCEAALLLACFALKRPGRHMALAGRLLAEDGVLTSRRGALGIVLAV